MIDKESSLKDLTEIRSLMERSTQYLSLSGLSGIAAGILALLGAALVYFDFAYIKIGGYSYADFVGGELSPDLVSDKIWFLLKVGAGVLILALAMGFYFTWRKAKKKNLKMWNNPAKRMLLALFVPLIAGGLFCVALVIHGLYGLVAPATLVFYGMALFSASHFTYKDIKFLGISEIVLGVIASFNIGYGLLFWAIGFGLLHIVYGVLMYFKYERN
ncbi:MAG: TMEM128 family protein [Flavobacteriales bacterium]